VKLWNVSIDFLKRVARSKRVAAGTILPGLGIVIDRGGGEEAHAGDAAARPSSVMKSRRLNGPNCIAATSHRIRDKHNGLARIKSGAYRAVELRFTSAWSQTRKPSQTVVCLLSSAEDIQFREGLNVRFDDR